ncbi:hypothetical protein B9479_006912 [Cryptococcus floricola]|uniref:Major facilitator superfamily (MFS) profile domain-containing protein n=1 Tax=Cryptococcus floricola TaxID=2591691 RepID=A0A5D3AQE8_9TREE|nr:hypothetical protein B9479_006912 [Cryptococcus floricola]
MARGETENSPLLAPPSPEAGVLTYTDRQSTSPAVHPPDENKLSFNRVGLNPSTFWVLCISMWVCSFLNAFDGVVVATLLGPISSSFKATNMASWLGTSYMLSVCCFTPIYGRLCNIIGRQYSMLLALTLFTLGNFFCSIAPSMNTLVAARALAGMGGGGLSSVGSTIMSDIVPITHRGIFQGLGNLAWGAGMGLGAPVGGVISDYLNWRWAFWFQIPILLLGVYLVHANVRYTIPSSPASGSATPNGTSAQTPYQLFKRIDFMGCILLAGWVGSALVAVSLKTNSTAEEALDWGHPIILSLFSASAVLFVLFLLVELKWAAEPIMPFELLVSRTPVAVAINNFVLSAQNYATLYSVPLFFTTVRQMSTSNAGAHLVPGSIMGMFGSLGTGIIVRYTKKYYWLNTFCALVGVVGTVLIATWDTTTSEWMLWSNMAFGSFSMGAVTTLTIVALIADVGPEHVAVATSLSYVFRTIGQVLGVSLSGALTQAVIERELELRIQGPDAEKASPIVFLEYQSLQTVKIIAAIRESSQSIRYLDEPLKTIAILSYQKALRAVFICVVVLGFITFLSGLGIREIDMHQILAKDKQQDDEEDGIDEQV